MRLIGTRERGQLSILGMLRAQLEADMPDLTHRETSASSKRYAASNKQSGGGHVRPMRNQGAHNLRRQQACHARVDDTQGARHRKGQCLRPRRKLRIAVCQAAPRSLG